jgi:transcription elongation GreA/GreB family factor
MKSRIDKTQILEACLEKQHELITNFKNREAELNEDTFSQNESASQSEDRRAGKYELLKAIGDELAFAQEELAYLNSLDIKNQDTVVAPGAVVVTEQFVFFIGVSSEKVEVEGETVFGISTKAPIYANMRGLEKGDMFQFNETKYIIEEVY